jgi:hypothetical protein
LSRRNLIFGAAVLAGICLVVGFLLLMSGGVRPFDDGPPITTLEPQLSRIATPLTIPIAQLRQVADRRLSGEIYRENREITTGVTVDISVRRREGPIQMAMVSSWLTTTVPLTVSGTPDIRLGPFRLPGGSAGGFEADLDVTLQTRARLNSDWSVLSETTAQIEVGRAELRVAGTVIDVAPVVSDILDRNVDRVTAPLDDYLTDLDIQAIVNPIWEGFTAPVRLSENPSVWLQVRPVEFSISPPSTQADDLRFDIGMEMYLEAVVGERPEDTELGDIPPLANTTSDTGSFSIAIPISLQLAEATRILSDRIIGREDSISESAVVRWLGVELGGTDNRLRVAVLFEAETGIPIVSELAGEMVLEGRPRYDSASETLTMQDIDYRLNSDSMLAGLADWLLHDRLRERIQSELVFPMGEIIESMRRDLQAQLGNISFGDYGTAEAAIQELEPRLAGVTDETLDLTVVADGTLRLNLDLASAIDVP